MQLFFGRHQDLERLLTLIEDYRTGLRNSLERLRETEGEVRAVATPYELMCLRFGLTRYEATLSWLKDVERELRAAASEGAPAGEVTP